MMRGVIDMLIENQKVAIKWNGKHKKFYESILDESGNQKYRWSKSGDIFEVDLNDLSKGSQAKIKVICDYCDKPFKKSYLNLLRERENSNIEKDCCKKCSPLKVREVYGTLDEIEYSEKDEYENSLKVYTKEMLINEFFRFKDEFGRFPKKVDIEALSNYPSANTYQENFGSWTKFLMSLDIIAEDGWYKDDEQVIKDFYIKVSNLCEINLKLNEKRTISQINKKAQKLNISIRSFINKREYNVTTPEEKLKSSMQGLKDLYSDLGVYPTTSEYDDYARLNKLIYRRNLEDRVSMRFADICIQELGGTNKDIKSKEILIAELTQLKVKLGRTPRANELKAHGLSEKKAYMRKFGITYQELIDSLGWEQATPRLRFKSEEEMLADYERLFNEIKRLPNSTDLQNCNYTSSAQTYVDKFGSLKDVWEILDLPYDANQDLSAGFVAINKRKEICRSSAELEISNILIENNINYSPEIKYSDLDDKLINKWKMDWYLSDSDIYVEYFGMYQETQIKRNTRIGRYSRKVKKKIDYCINNNIILISLYREDLTENYKGLLHKFEERGIILDI
jgi:hypothetical protein